MELNPAPLEEEVALSPDWLSGILGEAVASVEVTERLQTVATKVRFDAVLEDGSRRSCCVKAFFDPAMRRAGGMATEAVFYSELAPGLDLRLPPCIHAGIDEATGHGVVLMEDLVAAGASFLDPRSSYDVDQAAASLEQLAALHASHWGCTEHALPPSLSDRLGSLAGIFPAEQLQLQLDDGRAVRVPEAVRDGERVIAAMHALAGLGPRAGSTLVHGDLHTGNIFESPDGKPGLIDWQVVQRGSWALDVGYHLATALDADVRVSSSERELLDHYLGVLASRGVDGPSAEEAWWLYRAHLPYGFFLWGITRQVERPTIDHLIGRLGEAVASHGSLDLLEV